MNEFPSLNGNLITYTGASSSSLDVNQGDNINEVITKVVVGLTALINKVNACSFCEGEEGTVSLDASHISASSNIQQNNTIVTSGLASIATTPHSTGVNVNFNLDDAISSLGENVTVLKTKTTINGVKNGYPSTIVDTSKSSASINLRPDNFPATLESEIRYQDSTGEKTLKLNVPISGTTSSINLPLQGGVAGSVKLNTQEDLNNNLQDRLLNLENAVNTLNSVNISGFNSALPSSSNMTQAVAYILSEIEAIKGQLP
jgi:hypothetical protein